MINDDGDDHDDYSSSSPGTAAARLLFAVPEDHHFSISPQPAAEAPPLIQIWIAGKLFVVVSLSQRHYFVTQHRAPSLLLIEA
jgi:hypothetical protein